RKAVISAPGFGVRRLGWPGAVPAASARFLLDVVRLHDGEAPLRAGDARLGPPAARPGCAAAPVRARGAAPCKSITRPARFLPGPTRSPSAGAGRPLAPSGDACCRHETGIGPSR